MSRLRRISLTFLIIIFATVLTYGLVNAIYRRGGEQNTFYRITACRDGLTISVGLAAQFNTPPEASFNKVRLASDNSTILGGVPLTWTLDSGPVEVLDENGGNSTEALIDLLFSGEKTFRWTSGIQLNPGSRIILDDFEIRGQPPLSLQFADYFETIVGNCDIGGKVNPNISRVFRVVTENGGPSVPQDGLLISDLTIFTNTSRFPQGYVIADVNIGVYFINVSTPKVFLTSPSGRRIQLVQNVKSSHFGTRGGNFQAGLVRDLMPDFVLDDDSHYTLNMISSPYITAALQPHQPLRAFNGEDPHGKWALEIQTKSTTQTSVLQVWALEIEVAKPGSPLGFQNGVMPTKAYFKSRDKEITNALPSLTPYDCLVDGNLPAVFSSGDQNALLRWDISEIPPESQVYSATLELNITEASPGPYSIYALRRVWDAQTATWTRSLTDIAWQVPGARGELDRNPEPVAILTNILTGTMEIPLNETGISIVQEWVTKPENNFGLIIDETTTADGFSFSCRAELTPGLRPRLNVHYIAFDNKVYLPVVQTQ